MDSINDELSNGFENILKKQQIIIFRFKEQMSSAEEKVVCITGASRGIGRGLALGFAKKHYKIGICARKEADLEALAKLVEKQGTEVCWRVVDVTKRQEVRFPSTFFKWI